MDPQPNKIEEDHKHYVERPFPLLTGEEIDCLLERIRPAPFDALCGPFGRVMP